MFTIVVFSKPLKFEEFRLLFCFYLVHFMPLSDNSSSVLIVVIASIRLSLLIISFIEKLTTVEYVEVRVALKIFSHVCLLKFHIVNNSDLKFLSSRN